MKLNKLPIWSLFFIVFLFSCSNNEPISSEPETKNENPSIDSEKSYQELDIAYGDHEQQLFDLFLPAQRTLNTKVIILVHGGGWSAGDKTEMNYLKDLIRVDFPEVAIANINYRLADQNNKPFPMQIEDITTFVNFLKDNKIKYTISDEISFVGVSAGGHLSLLWSYGHDINNKVKMVASIVGPTNLIDPEYLNAVDTNTQLKEFLNLYGITPELEYLKTASPLHQVTESAPPTILFYGGKDPLVPTSQGVDLRDKLQNLNINHEFTLYPDAGHGWIGIELLDTWTKLKIFTNTYL